MLTEYDFFGHWFYFFIALGMFFISKRETYGWLFRLFGEIGWMWLGWKMQMTSIFMWGCLFLLIDFNGFFTWFREDKAEEAKVQWLEEQAQWLAAGVQALEKTEEVLNEDIKRESEGEAVAAKRSRPRKKSVRSAPRRRSKPTNGKRGSRSNAKPRSSKKSGRNVRVQKDNRRTNTKSSRAS